MTSRAVLTTLTPFQRDRVALAARYVEDLWRRAELSSLEQLAALIALTTQQAKRWTAEPSGTLGSFTRMMVRSVALHYARVVGPLPVGSSPFDPMLRVRVGLKTLRQEIEQARARVQSLHLADDPLNSSARKEAEHQLEEALSSVEILMQYAQEAP